MEWAAPEDSSERLKPAKFQNRKRRYIFFFIKKKDLNFPSISLTELEDICRHSLPNVKQICTGTFFVGESLKMEGVGKSLIPVLLFCAVILKRKTCFLWLALILFYLYIMF